MLTKCVHGLYITDWCRACYPTREAWDAQFKRASRATWTALTGTPEPLTADELADALQAIKDIADEGFLDTK